MGAGGRRFKSCCPDHLKLNDKQIVIIGGGLQGLATALTLIERGEDVLVLEREEDVAHSTSFANAGMLTPSQSNPWNSPDDILQVLSGIGKKDSPMTLSLSLIHISEPTRPY